MSRAAGATSLRSRTPGYRAVKKLAGNMVRRSRTAMRLVNRLAAAAAEAPPHPRPMRFRPGRNFPGDSARHLPIVVIVATGLSDGDAERVAEEFEQAQLVTGSFRPLFVIDNADFAPFRNRGYVVERVMRSEELAAANPRDSHSEYLFTRLRSIAHDYGAVSVVPLPAGAPMSLHGPTARLVGAVHPR